MEAGDGQVYEELDLFVHDDGDDDAGDAGDAVIHGFRDFDYINADVAMYVVNLAVNVDANGIVVVIGW